MRTLRIVGAVLRNPRSFALCLVVTWLIISAAVWLPNSAAIFAVWGSSASLLQKITFLGTLYQSIATNFTFISALYTLTIAVLFGIQVALLHYYIRSIQTQPAAWRGVGGAGVGGLVAGALGIGCAACGTFILTTVLALFGAAGLIAFLPLHGQEFGLIGVALLLYAVHLLVRKIDSPHVCPV